MEHRGIEYQVVQTTNPMGWIWTADLDGRTRTGVSFSRANAIFNAVAAIEKALSAAPKAK
jgi:hypothetical protein